MAYMYPSTSTTVTALLDWGGFLLYTIKIKTLFFYGNNYRRKGEDGISR